ncbi:hypothetical protein FPANT_11907 [Fusarium pseudoanthophilum]|uniref:Uncharacterized protein n=1 Tax=Fusarium pseudoanthophilum TaxID=48495 RepID=A0A8H5NPH4_9HYPO|nr:hypothetical protein FPANT_11907 [Fusarium pseudoanthophilum]
MVKAPFVNAMLFNVFLEQQLKESSMGDKGKALCEIMKTEYTKIKSQMPNDLANNLAFDLSVFVGESVMTDYDDPGHNSVFQEVAAKTKIRKNSKTLLAVTFPQRFFLAVTLGANNPSLAPAKEFMETHWVLSAGTSSQPQVSTANTTSSPQLRHQYHGNSLGIYDELFTDINIADENAEWPLEKVLSADSLAEANEEKAVDPVSLDEVLGDIRHDIANLEEKVKEVMDIVDSLAADISETKKSTDRVPVLEKSIADLVTFLHTVHGTDHNDDGDASAGGPADASNGKRQRTE